MTERDETLVTKGIKSTVYAYDPETGKPAGRFGRYGMGHVALFDWDDHVTPADARDLLREKDIRGPTVIWESSEGSYHGWNLTVREWTHTADVLDAGRDDTGHLRVGRDRGWWRLRAGPKLTINDDIYKPAPEAIGAVTVGADEPVRFSRPHARLAAKLTPVDTRVLPARWPEAWEPVGDLFEVAMYSTFTDVGKLFSRRAE